MSPHFFWSGSNRKQVVLSLSQGYQQFLLSLVETSHRLAIWVVVGAVLSSIGLLAYTVTHLKLDTHPLNLLDSNLAFRTLQLDYEKTFPILTALIVVVIDADDPDTAENAGDHLTENLAQKSEFFSFIYQPGRGPFFDKNGLLYLDIEELWNLDHRLTKWEPFLGRLTHDPSLRGLFGMVESALDSDPDPEHQKLITEVLDLIAQTVEAQLANQPNPQFWREAMLDVNNDSGEPIRQFVLVKPRIDYSTLEAAGSPLHIVREQAKRVAQEHEVRIRLTGSVVMEEEERAMVAEWAKVAALLSFLLVWGILWLGLRSFGFVLSLLLTLLVGLVWTAGLATLVIGSLNLISATAPVLFIGLGVDFGIQFGMRYKEFREQGMEHLGALQQAVGHVGGALTLAAVAAALSFFSFLPTSYRGLAELGVIAGMGMVVALFANLTFLPALLTIWRVRFTSNPIRETRRWHMDFSTSGPRHLILAIALPVAVLSLWFVPQTRFDFNPLNLKDPSSEAVATFQELLHDPNATPYTIQVLTDNLRASDDMAQRLKALAVVDKVVTLSSFVPEEQDEKLMLIDEMGLVLQPIVMPGTPRPPPDSEEQAHIVQRFQRRLIENEEDRFDKKLTTSMTHLATLLGQVTSHSEQSSHGLEELETRLLRDLPKNLTRLRHLLMAEGVTLEDLPPDITERYRTSDGRVRVEVYPEEHVANNEGLRHFVREVKAVAPQAVGTPATMVGAGDTIVTACLQATGLALLAAMVLLWLVLHRLRDAVLVLLPLILTITLTMAASVVLQLPLNLANVVALPLVLGLGIAFGIYLVLRKREGTDTGHLVQSSTSRAVIFSALTTMASFGTLAFASHQGMASMGKLLTLTLALVLWCSLMILPAVLGELESRGWWK